MGAEYSKTFPCLKVKCWINGCYFIEVYFVVTETWLWLWWWNWSWLRRSFILIQMAFESFKWDICAEGEQNFTEVEDKILKSNSRTLGSQGYRCWDVGVPCSVSSVLDNINVLTFLFYYSRVSLCLSGFDQRPFPLYCWSWSILSLLSTVAKNNLVELVS